MMKSERKSFSKIVFSVFNNRIVLVISNFLINIIIARELGPEGRGLLTAVLFYPTIILTLAELGIRQSTVYIVGRKKALLNQVIASLLRLYLVSSVIGAFACYYLIRSTISFDIGFSVMVLASLIIPLKLVSSYSVGIFLGIEKIKEFNRTSWVPVIINLILVAGFSITLSLTIQLALIAKITGIIVIGVISSWYIYSNLNSFEFRYNKNITKLLIKYGVVYAAALFITKLNYKINIYLLQEYSTEVELGYYSIGITLSESLWEITTIMSAVLFARSANIKKKNKDKFSYKLTTLYRLVMALLTIIAFVLYFTIEQIIVLLYGMDYLNSSDVFIYMLPGVIVLIFYKIFYTDLAGRGKPYKSLIAFIPAILLNIFIAINLIPQYGANGAALSATISYIFATIIFIYIYKKETGIPYSEFFIPKGSDIIILKDQFKKLIK